MRITQGPQGEIILHRESGSRIYKDTTLLYQAAKLLNTKGANVIRKEACKDGHLTSEGNYYLVDRKRHYGWHFSHYQLRPAYQDYNDGKLCLQALGNWPVLS
jgi:hypothetical protein